MKHAFIRAAVVTAVLLPAAAFAQMAGSVTADLNLREGPGSGYPVIATIPAGEAVTIDGCLEGGTWCAVSYSGQTGYGYGRYLIAESEGSTVVVSERPGLVGIVTAPVSILAGAAQTVVGTLDPAEDTTRTRASSTESSFRSRPEVLDYVRNNPPGEPIYLEGEAVRGARVPAGVPLANVPDTDFAYANINGDSVVIDRDTRRVVDVIR